MKLCETHLQSKIKCCGGITPHPPQLLFRYFCLSIENLSRMHTHTHAHTHTQDGIVPSLRKELERTNLIPPSPQSIYIFDDLLPRNTPQRRTQKMAWQLYCDIP